VTYLRYNPNNSLEVVRQSGCLGEYSDLRGVKCSEDGGQRCEQLHKPYCSQHIVGMIRSGE
jgi:hypothetical protein